MTSWEFFPKEDLFIVFSRSRVTLILWSLSEKIFQESSSGQSKTNDESGKQFVGKQVWIIDSGLLFCHSKLWLRLSWLKKAVMTRVSLIISFADIISTLVKEMVMSTTNKALCVVYNEKRYILKVLQFLISMKIIQISSSSFSSVASFQLSSSFTIVGVIFLCIVKIVSRVKFSWQARILIACVYWVLYSLCSGM